MATMLDVSRMAGVSKSTVSRVLNGTAKISESTRQAVFAAIKELNYRPNVLAQSLSKQSTNTIGLVIPKGSSISQVLTMLIDRCNHLVEQAGKYLMITQTTDHPDGEMTAIKTLVDRQCDAVLFYSSNVHQYSLGTEQLSDLIEELPVPLVVLNRHLPKHPEHCVWINQARSARLPVDYLLQHGHRRIAYIAGPLTQLSAQQRLHGYRQALHEADIELDPLLIVEGDRMYSGGYSACHQLVQRNIKFTALCCFNDHTAIGALKALHEAGIAVPEQVSVFGLDNEPILDYMEPAISSVDVDINAFVDRAVEMLFSMLEGEASSRVLPDDFPGELVLRGSTRALA